jgi:hypothetical protein
MLPCVVVWVSHVLRFWFYKNVGLYGKMRVLRQLLKQENLKKKRLSVEQTDSQQK